MKIGILALQGDFKAHSNAINSLGHETVEVRKSKDLNNISGLVIPGGESTTMLKLLTHDLEEKIKKDTAAGMGIFGTCAGLILISKKVTNPSQASLGLIAVETERNSFGRQINSFITDKILPENSFKNFTKLNQSGTFIRAPQMISTGTDVENLATYDGTPVFVRSKKVFGATFHPEISMEKSNQIYSFIIKEWE